jgi:hypothetical protein
MDKKKSTNKLDVSAGRRNITVWAESAGRWLCKNRILYLIFYIYIYIYRKNNIIFRIKKNIFNLKYYF